MLKDKKGKNTEDEVVVIKKKTAKQAMEELNRREESMADEDASDSTVKNILNKVKRSEEHTTELQSLMRISV